jgi:hypothetical protein
MGGEIYNSKPEGHHTSTQMGSGDFANSYIEEQVIFEIFNTWISVANL